MLSNGFINELYKLKGSGIFWLTTLGTVASNLIFVATAFGMKMIKPDLIEGNVMESWDRWVNFHYQGILPMLLPMYLVILCALAVHQERRFGTWKILAVLPMNPQIVFLSKLLVVMLVFVVSHLIFVILIMLLPYLFQFSMSGESMHFQTIFQLFGSTILTSMGIIALVYLISYYSRSFVFPLAVGIIGFVISQLLHDNEVMAWFIPFALPIEAMDYVFATQRFPVNFILISLSFFIVFSLLGSKYSSTRYPRH